LNHNCVGSGKFSNIKTYNIAISDRTGNKEFYYRVDAAGDGRLYNPTECGDGNEWLSRNVPVETLSSLQDKLGMNGIEGGIVDLIKIDCEGSEYEILKDLDFFKRKENKDCEVILELHKTQIESRKLDYEGFMDYLLSYFEMSRLTGERMGEEQMKERIRDGDVLGNKYVVLKFLK
jgi:FkbM family methyltransferase